ncbi:hypothetical protein Tco_0576981, partial [Tanacetum coccineum]
TLFDVITKYYYFHEDHGHDTNDCRELRHQIEEAVKLGQLSHLVKGIKKGKTKARPDSKKEVSGRTYQRAWGDHVFPCPRAIKFRTPKGTGTMLSTYEPRKRDEIKKKSKATCSEITKNVLSCEDAEERIIINTKYPEQTVGIGMQLPTNIKERLWKLLIANVDVFA